MNLTEIKERFQNEYGDVVQAQVVDTLMTRWANSAQRDIVRRTDCLLVTNTLSFAAGDVTKAAPATFLKFSHAGWYENNTVGNAFRTLMYTPYNDLVRRVGFPNAGMSRGAPTHIYIKGASATVGLWPLPDKTYDIYLESTKIPTALSGGSDTPEIPVVYHELIVLYMLKRAAHLDDDVTRYQSYELEYQEALSQTLSDASNPSANEYPQVRDVSDEYYSGITSW